MTAGTGPDIPAAGRALAAGRRAFGDGWRPGIRALAPGRIELLGNHLDYNGGPVLAAAIDRFAVALAADAQENRSEVAVTAADIAADGVLEAGALAGWRNAGPPSSPLDYARGVVAAVQGRTGLTLRAPAEVAFAGDVPIGLGLSSSAALCVALALALTRRAPGPTETVLVAQEAEHRAGTPCGTMDQSASVAGGVIRFDGATLEVERLSPDLGDLVFVVADSGVERSLGASSYPRRVEESRRALELARARLGIDLPHLASLTRAQLLELERDGGLPEPLGRRVRHVVTETERAEAGVAALHAGDWEHFGRLMTASGRSSATDYAISHPRVEELVGEALGVAGVLGARMMGGGEGGAVLILLPQERVRPLEAALLAGYYRRHGMADRSGLVYVCRFGPGASVEAV